MPGNDGPKINASANPLIPRGEGAADAAAAGRAGDEKRLAVLEHDGRRHRRERALARSRRVGVAADETIGIGRTRLGGEVVELVVEQDAGALGDETEAVAEVERGGIG